MSLRRMLRWLMGSALVGAAVLLPDLPAEAVADGCAAGISSDFNGDGRTDAAVADPRATVAGEAEAGRVVVLYGDADTRVGEGARGIVTQGADSVGGIPEAGDRFGSALATADLDCDGYTDLVVGTPYEDISGQVDSGYAQLIYGAPGGLGTGDPSRNLVQSDFGRAITAGDQFGYSVDALEDVGQGGTPASGAFAVAIGVPGGNVGGDDNAGWAGFLVAFDGGNIPLSASQDTPGVAGSAEPGDRFGAAISLNYLIGEGVGEQLVDAAVGVPREDVGNKADAGAITILQDLYYDDLPEGGVGYDQSSAGVPGSAEAGDRFGAVLDTVRAGGTTRLAVGALFEDIGADADAGSVQLFSSNGTTLTVGSSLSQDTAGVSGGTEPNDVFGSALAFAPPGLGDTKTRLAVGIPGEDGAANASGLVQVFPIGDLDAETGWTQASPSVPGAVEANDRFGTTLGVVAGPSERVLAVGVPDDVTNASGMVDVLPFGGGTPRAWIPGAGGVPSASGVAFGAALASAGV
jgi:hypothetical protein